MLFDIFERHRDTPWGGVRIDISGDAFNKLRTFLQVVQLEFGAVRRSDLNTKHTLKENLFVGPLAQLVEHRPFKAGVPSSILGRLMVYLLDGLLAVTRCMLIHKTYRIQ